MPGGYLTVQFSTLITFFKFIPLLFFSSQGIVDPAINAGPAPETLEECRLRGSHKREFIAGLLDVEDNDRVNDEGDDLVNEENEDDD